MTPAPGEVLDWDTQFFGFRTGKAEGSLTPAQAAALLAWAAEEKLRCLYFLAGAADTATTAALEDHGFHFQDIRLTMARRGPAPAGPRQTVREASAADLDALQAIARVSHHDSRFYRDPRFPRERCDALYAAWIERSCREGFADAVLTAVHEDRPAGYVTCLLRGGEGRIGLFAVAPEAQGRGLGAALLDAALAWFHAKGVHTVTTVTQGANTAAQRVYQRAGFQTASVQLWYHRWFDAGSPQ